jgi:nicotinamide riboside transporter PnuC
MDYFEIIGYISGAMAIVGVVLNNYRLRACFLLWLVSNAASAIIHAHGGIWSLLWRDVVFFVLAFHGWFTWGRNNG